MRTAGGRVNAFRRLGAAPPKLATVHRMVGILFVALSFGCAEASDPPPKHSESGRQRAIESSNRIPESESPNPAETSAESHGRELAQEAVSEQGKGNRVGDTGHEVQDTDARAAKSLLEIDDPMLAAMESRFGKPDGLMRCDERLYLDYNLENGYTLSLVASGTAYGARRLRIVDVVYGETEHLNHFIGLNVTMTGNVKDDGKFGEYLQTHRRRVYLPYGITRVRHLPINRTVSVTGLLDYQPSGFPAHDDKGQAVAMRPPFYSFREGDIEVELVEDRADESSAQP